MLPNRGKCNGVFILAHAAKFARPKNLKQWVEAAKQRPTFLAAALNFENIAEEMLKFNLAFVKDKIVLDESLLSIVEVADHWTLAQIARLILLRTRPVWIDLVVQGGKVSREYIPEMDFLSLEWLGAELDQILTQLAEELSYKSNELRRQLVGDAAEQLIFQSLSLSGLKVRHVSKVSDSFGYDIEAIGNRVDRIEVKGTSAHYQGQFHISRNEYEKSLKFVDEWRVVQVLFDSKAYVCDEIDISFVSDVRYLTASVLRQFIPPDTGNFRWTESALLCIPIRHWLPAEFELCKKFRARGFRI